MLSPQHFSTQSVCSTFKNFARSFLFLKKTRGNQNLFWACYNVNKISRDLYWRWAKWKNKEELENWKWLPFLERKSNKDGQPQNRAWLVPMLKYHVFLLVWVKYNKNMNEIGINDLYLFDTEIDRLK